MKSLSDSLPFFMRFKESSRFSSSKYGSYFLISARSKYSTWRLEIKLILIRFSWRCSATFCPLIFGGDKFTSSLIYCLFWFDSVPLTISRLRHCRIWMTRLVQVYLELMLKYSSAFLGGMACVFLVIVWPLSNIEFALISLFTC